MDVPFFSADSLTLTMSKPLSIRMRLLGGLIASLTLVLAASGGGLYWLQSELLYREFDRRLDRAMMQGLREFRRETPDPTAPDFTPQPAPDGLVFIGTWREDQPNPERFLPAPQDAASSQSISPLPDFPTLAALAQSGEHQSLRLADNRHVRLTARRGPPMSPGNWRDRRRDDPSRPSRSETPDEATPPNATAPDSTPSPQSPPQPPREERPAHILFAAADLAPLHVALYQWALMLLAGGAGAELLVVSVVLVAVRRGLAPLREMETRIAAIDDTDLTARLGVTHLPAELRPVVGQLNKLLARMEAAFQREREFTANAAHEFMTPLAAIRTQIEVALRRPRSAPEYHDTLTQSLQTALSLQRLVESLLDLARLDCGQVHTRPESFDAAGLLRELVEAMQHAAESRGCVVRYEGPEELIFTTDRQLLERIAGNLLRNAAEYADVDSTIVVGLRHQGDEDGGEIGGGGVELRVENAATNLAAEDVARMGDRFWRRDESRTDTARHSGLGLSIVSRCVHVLGGQWRATLQGQQLTVTVHIPGTVA